MKRKLTEKPFHLNDTSEQEAFKIIQNIDISKAAGIDNLSGKCLKDGAISEICNLSIKSRTFSNACQVAKFKPYYH